MHKTLLIVIVLALGSFSHSAHAAITSGNVTTDTSGSSGTRTIAHTNNGDYLDVCVADSYPGVSPTGVTYNGVAMTELGERPTPDFGVRVSEWGLVAPTSGTHNVVLTWPSSGNAATTIRSYSGVDATTPTGTSQVGGGVFAGASATVSSATGELVVDCGAASNINGSTAFNPDGSQTTDSSSLFASDISGVWGGTSHKAGASSVTMQWNTNTAEETTMIAVPLKPAAGGGGGTIIRSILALVRAFWLN